MTPHNSAIKLLQLEHPWLKAGGFLKGFAPLFREWANTHPDPGHITNLLTGRGYTIRETEHQLGPLPHIPDAWGIDPRGALVLLEVEDSHPLAWEKFSAIGGWLDDLPFPSQKELWLARANTAQVYQRLNVDQLSEYIVCESREEVIELQRRHAREEP